MAIPPQSRDREGAVGDATVQPLADVRDSVKTAQGEQAVGDVRIKNHP